jgi:hypothetical protein
VVPSVVAAATVEPAAAVAPTSVESTASVATVATAVESTVVPTGPVVVAGIAGFEPDDREVSPAVGPATLARRRLVPESESEDADGHHGKDHQHRHAFDYTPGADPVTLSPRLVVIARLLA